MSEPNYSLARDDDHPDNWSRFSGVLAQLYDCPKCGEAYHVQIAEEIDTDNDEIYEYPVCSNCGSSVNKKTHDGIPVWHPLTNEELYWDNFSLDEEDEWDDE